MEISAIFFNPNNQQLNSLHLGSTKMAVPALECLECFRGSLRPVHTLCNPRWDSLVTSAGHLLSPGSVSYDPSLSTTSRTSPHLGCLAPNSIPRGRRGFSLTKRRPRLLTPESPPPKEVVGIQFRHSYWYSPCELVVKNVTASAEDTGSIPGPGRSHLPPGS